MHRRVGGVSYVARQNIKEMYLKVFAGASRGLGSTSKFSFSRRKAGRGGVLIVSDHSLRSRRNTLIVPA